MRANFWEQGPRKLTDMPLIRCSWRDHELKLGMRVPPDAVVRPP
jgi:hypothetical protein